MEKIIEKVEQVLKKDRRHYERLKNRNWIRMNISGDNCQVNCRIFGNDEQELVMALCEYPTYVPEEKRLMITELITRINNELKLGNFEMDIETGELQFRTSAVTTNLQPGEDFIRYLIYLNVATADKWHPAIMQVIYSDAEPKQTISEMNKARS